MGRLSGKVALITGAGGGIGRATTLLFSSHGAQVVAVDIDKVNGLKTVQMSEEQGGDTLFVEANIALATDCENMIRRTTEHYGKLDILFNNAGIMHPDDSHATDTEENIWDMTMDINLKGVFFGCKYGIPALRNNGGGSFFVYFI
ncbi:MAG: SDR family NAD(P)-dependent oxidoreductase, partial [Planctomycetes bacterium]|nr:SDR family NAD(P)-dependent oxidoreductase [Planctomycetota bacterium]